MTTELLMLNKAIDMIVQLMPIIIAGGILIVARKFYTLFIDAINPPDQPTEKRKNEPVSFFEMDTEPDYVVGFGDDGELLYASDKRKNDEVDQ